MVNRLRWIAQDIVSGASRLFRVIVKSIWPLTRYLLVGFLFCFCYLGATLGALLAFTLAFTAHGILAGLLALCLAMSVGVVLLQCMSEHF
jgi:high-affinity nickel permease